MINQLFDNIKNMFEEQKEDHEQQGMSQENLKML